VINGPELLKGGNRRELGRWEQHARIPPDAITMEKVSVTLKSKTVKRNERGNHALCNEEFDEKNKKKTTRSRCNCAINKKKKAGPSHRRSNGYESRMYWKNGQFSTAAVSRGGVGKKRVKEKGRKDLRRGS